jgi:hypothetical protein
MGRNEKKKKRRMKVHTKEKAAAAPKFTVKVKSQGW